ncbi:hypothetical protein SLE2022_189730 [Rubroshorea leprosula]
MVMVKKKKKFPPRSPPFFFSANVMELPLRRSNAKTVLLVTVALLLLTIVIPIYYPLLGYPVYLLKHYSTKSSSGSSSSSSSSSLSAVDVQAPVSAPPPRKADEDDDDDEDGIKFCDLFSGEWVPNPKAPYYTNSTCSAIYERQDCMKHGRPDTGYMKWRWKPDGCDLPIFNPVQFLEIVRGKSMAFIGDSLSGNQIQSLICLISRVDYPISVPTPDENFKLWNCTYYNFTFALLWTPHLVKATQADPNGPTGSGLFNLYLDEFDQRWTTHIQEFDYIVISAAHWFYRPSVFYENNQITGCHYCLLNNVSDLTERYGYRKAIRTAFRAINECKNFKGVTFLRTISPPHFENGPWNQGGNCVRTKPFKRKETPALEEGHLEIYKIQLEEFRAAKKEGKKKGKKFRLMDTMKAMLMRPDGHPSRYGHFAQENVTANDCLHWCVPGPIDAWNDFLLEMLKMEEVRSYAEKVFSSDNKM